MMKIGDSDNLGQEFYYLHEDQADVLQMMFRGSVSSIRTWGDPIAALVFEFSDGRSVLVGGDSEPLVFGEDGLPQA